MRKRHTNMRFGLTAYPKKPLIIAHSGVSRANICLKVVRSLHQFAYLVMREAKALARSCVHTGSSEPSPHADVITIVSCADQFIVLIFHCGPFILFSYSYYNLKRLKFRNIVRAHISRLVSLLVVQINSWCLFAHNGLKTTTGIQVFSQVNKYTLSCRFLHGNIHGCVFA